MGATTTDLEIVKQYSPHGQKQSDYDLVVVDDDHLVLEIVRRNYVDHPFALSVSKRVQEALDFLSVHQIRLLIVDYRMPLMNGLEFIERSKRYPLMSKARIIITSSVSLPESDEKIALTLGAQFVLKERLTDSGYLEELVTSNSIIR